jgi:hypothetical protein
MQVFPAALNAVDGGNRRDDKIDIGPENGPVRTPW